MHRDIKPGNVIVTATGLKLLDFGLARQAPAAEALVDGAATLTNVTEPGTLRGTPQYMAPEQLMGTAADARSDLFALGVVIYELVTGSHPFAAPTQAAVAQRILTIDPEPLSRLCPEASPLVQRVVEKCLRRDPELRWQSAADLAAVLEFLHAKSSESAGLPANRARTGRRWLAMTAAVMAATALVTWQLLSSPRKDAEPIEFAVNLPAGMETSRIDGAVALSPEGRLLAFTALENGNSHLFLRDSNSVEARQLNGTDGAIWPFFSPDGQWIGFSNPRGLFKISVSGGTPLPIVSAPSTWASWAETGRSCSGRVAGPASR